MKIELCGFWGLYKNSSNLTNPNSDEAIQHQWSLNVLDISFSIQGNFDSDFVTSTCDVIFALP